MSKKARTHTKPEPEGRVVVEDLDAAARLTGYTREQLQAWKAEGCPAFKAGNRIHLHEIPAWLADNPQAGRESSAELVLAQIEVREALLRAANNEQKLAERRKLFAKGDDVRRSVVRSWLAMKLKLLALSQKMSQPLSLMSDPREIQQQLDAELCAALASIERNEWFDAALAKKVEAALK